VTDSLSAAAAALRGARAITILTGAGVSAASGIPTFRGEEGLWRQVRAETLATPEAFENDPKLVWEWYDWRRGMIRNAAPNAAHDVLARWTRERGATLITQNVDGLHERSGARGLIRLHGSIWHMRCWRRCSAGAEDWVNDTVPLDPLPPRCPHCGDLVRPGVVWFGESLDSAVLERALTAAASCDLFLTVGTSAVVYPAASLIPHAKRAGATVIEINPDATGASHAADITIRMKADEALKTLDRCLVSG
jgi:NAD-dependent protein deacetylase/lipoamidase